MPTQKPNSLFYRGARGYCGKCSKRRAWVEVKVSAQYGNYIIFCEKHNETLILDPKDQYQYLCDGPYAESYKVFSEVKEI